MHTLVYQRPDWTSPTWRAAFLSILPMVSQPLLKRHTGLEKTATFCSVSHVNPLPLSESVLCKFVPYLADESLQHRTMKTYLSGLRFVQIKAGLGDPFQSQMPRLDLCFEGRETRAS